ncbi:ABC transporter permease [Shewanella sp. SHSM-M6]|uniref:ABC transporter permease n=2 Tax=Shewanella salipaludis TaxID=2723052 RepID=A0A972FXT9_9GAMM|nr:ABC transporter permease [Shewanella salipaludis]NMH65233.1 ABC transporter permease [Shewanella salipaludis]
MTGPIRRELHALWHSPWQLALVTYVPLLSVLALWWLFSAGLPRQLPVALVDLDHSRVSRMLGRQLAANAVTAPVAFADLPAAVAAMRRAEVYALVLLPKDLQRDLLRGAGHSPSIDIRYNSQFLLMGKLLSSQLQQSLGAGLLELAGLKQLVSGVPRARVAVNLRPVQSQTTALFNRNSNYVGFLVPPVLIALWQLLAMLVFANSFNRELTPAPHDSGLSLAFWPKLLAKLGVYLPLLALHGAGILCFLYLYLGLPFAGSLSVLVIAQCCMLLAIWCLVLTVFLLMADSARVVSFCTALFAPAFAFMGITFPVHEMPSAAQYWRLLMPSSHYIDAHVAQVSYGLGWPSLPAQLASYWGYLLLLPVIYLLGRRLQTRLQPGCEVKP